MYNWRQQSSRQRCEIIKLRKLMKYPWHSPPHFDGDGLYHITAANFEHKIIIGKDYDRMIKFSHDLLDRLDAVNCEVKAWCVLPNHYHLLIKVNDVKQIIKTLGTLHGRTSFYWNCDDNLQGRQCWSKTADRKIRTTDHYYATLNYIHHNPVKHQYVKKWDEWYFSSAKQFLDEVGHEKTLAIWTQYPVLDYGKKWDF